MIIIPISVGDTLTLKKKHPCGSDSFKVTRVGSDIGLRCEGCGRDVMTPRVKIEKAIKRVNGQPARVSGSPEASVKTDKNDEQ